MQLSISKSWWLQRQYIQAWNWGYRLRFFECGLSMEIDGGSMGRYVLCIWGTLKDAESMAGQGVHFSIIFINFTNEYFSSV